MHDEEKTRDELLAELAVLRKQIGLIMGWQATAAPSPDGVVHCDDTLFRALVESAPLGFYVYDPAPGRVLFFNHRFCELWALTDLEMRLKSGELSHEVVSAACSRLALTPPPSRPPAEVSRQSAATPFKRTKSPWWMDAGSDATRQPCGLDRARRASSTPACSMT